MLVLWLALACWFASLALLVALRLRVTTNRATLRRPRRSVQLRKLRMHAGVAGAHGVVRPASPPLAAFDPHR